MHQENAESPLINGFAPNLFQQNTITDVTALFSWTNPHTDEYPTAPRQSTHTGIVEQFPLTTEPQSDPKLGFPPVQQISQMPKLSRIHHQGISVSTVTLMAEVTLHCLEQPRATKFQDNAAILEYRHLHSLAPFIQEPFDSNVEQSRESDSSLETDVAVWSTYVPLQLVPNASGIGGGSSISPHSRWVSSDPSQGMSPSQEDGQVIYSATHSFAGEHTNAYSRSSGGIAYQIGYSGGNFRG